MHNSEHHDEISLGGDLIKESDARDMIRLLGEVVVRDGSLVEKRIMLMEGLCQLIDADAWVWAMVGRSEAGESLSFSVYLKGGFTEEQFAIYLKANEHEDMKVIQVPFLEEYAAKKTHITRLRQQIDKKGTFPNLKVTALWREADLGPIILSFKPTSNGQTSGICLFRRFEKSLFGLRESRMTHIMLTEVPWLHDEAWPNHPASEVSDISPRLNTVLNLLLQGRARKQIASELDISINTVNGYARDLYRRFNIHSQAELISKFVDGDGGDRP